ncbi:MAG: aldehyde dehydrogenase family protein [Marinifilaceae bacterium]
MMKYNNILQSQKDFFDTNSTKDISFRIEQLKHLKTVLKNNEDRLFKAIYEDLGKSEFECILTELAPIESEINYSIKKIKKWTKKRKFRTDIPNLPAKSYVMPEPLGCTLVISAWNYPYHLSLLPVIAAITAGNTAILKPSEISPRTSALMAELINSEFPKEFLYVVEGGVKETTELINLKFDKIFYTGNGKVGKIIAIAAANNLCPITLELGGKSPVFIDASCDIKMSAQRLVWAKFLNAGQTCIAPDYVIIDKMIEKEFLEELKNNIEKYYKSDSDISENYTRIINERHFDRIDNIIDRNKIFVGGKTNKDNLFISPTILHNIDWKDKIMQDEIFGPILPVITYENINDAIKEVKKKDKALSLYIFSKNKIIIDKILNEVSFGGGCINDAIMQLSNNKLPFGGVGESGIGRYHGIHGFNEFSNLKSIVHKSFLFETSLKYFPYNKKKLSILKKLI